jgi:hypothetical protein
MNMDLQDLQDDRRSDLKHGEITEKIIGCALEVINELGTGFLESVYEKAMAIAPEHQAQIINYLKATGIEVGLLINFGNPKLEYKRFTRHK